METVQVIPWQGQAPGELAVREKIRAEGLNGYVWSNGPGDEYSAHTHPFDKVLYVLSGSITWILPQTDEELTTSAGDRLNLPKGTAHAARVGANGVTCFEAQV